MGSLELGTRKYIFFMQTKTWLVVFVWRINYHVVRILYVVKIKQFICGYTLFY